MNTQLFAQQKQTGDGERNANDSLPRWWFAEETNPRDGHDRRAASKNCRNGGQGTAFLEKKEKGDRTGADANAGKQRVIETSSTKFLIPSSRISEDREVDQDRQCGAGFDNETTETFTDAIRSKPVKI